MSDKRISRKEVKKEPVSDTFHGSGGSDMSIPDAVRSQRGSHGEAPVAVVSSSSSAVPLSYPSLGYSGTTSTATHPTPYSTSSTSADSNAQHTSSSSSATTPSPLSSRSFLESEWMQSARPGGAHHKPVKASAAVATPEWTQNIIGREWEVYWKKSACRLIVASPKTKESSSESDEDDDDEAMEPDDEETWYDATVLAVDEGKSHSKSSRTTKTYFQVRFLGEHDTLYSMALSPDLVRPSARAWIRRTKALLEQPPASNTATTTTESNTKQWEDALPPDTTILSSDRADLKRIEQEIQRDFPVFYGARFHNSSDESSNAAFSKLRSEHAACAQLMKLVRTQMFLRTKLAPVELEEDDDEEDEEAANNDGGRDEKGDDESIVTETYVDYLLQCLNDLERACQWHYQCWKLLHRLFAVDRNYQQPPPSISREQLIRDFLAQGRSTLTTLFLQDPSCGAFQKKSRKRSHESSSCGEASSEMHARPSKRSRTVPEQWIVSTSVVKDTHDQVDDSLLSSWDTIKAFVSQVCETDQRWYTKYFGNMLCSIFFMVVSPYLKWERNALFFLGESDACKDKAPMMQEECNHSEEHDVLRGLVKYEEIEILIESANHDRLLKCFTLSSYVSRLCDKLAAIDAFEVRAWDLIVAVLEEPEVTNREEDPTLSGLKELCSEARIQNGPIANVRPIGRATSRLYPEVLDNAILYRQWFLDLKHAESVRERTVFIQSLVARLSDLPPLPARSDAEDSMFDEKSRIRLDGVMLRVRYLSDQCLEHVPKFNHYQSLLAERGVPSSSRRHEVDRNSGFYSVEGVMEALKELRLLPVISAVEEMLAIRCDILWWEAEARKILAVGKEPSFVDVESLHRGIEEIRDGASRCHKETIEGAENISLVDAEMTTFVQSEFSSELLSQWVTQVEDLYSRSRSWKDRVDAIIDKIQSYGNHAAQGHMAALHKIELKEMDQLRAEYFSLKVGMTETFDALLKIHTPAVEWMTSVKNTLSNDSVPFEEMLHFLIRKEPFRPLGIKIEPDRDVVESMQELLRWYVSVQDFISKRSRDSELLRSLLFVGLQVLARFCQKRNAGAQFTVPSTAAEFLVASQIHREMCKSLEISELYKDPLSCNVIERMTNDYQDESRGAPMFFLLLSLWALYADDFVARCFDLKLRAETNLVGAKELWAARPVSSSSSTGLIAAKDMMLSLRVADLERLVIDGETTEKETRTLFASAESICQDCDFDAIEPTLVVLKEKLANFKGRFRNVGMVTLDPRLESQLEFYVKLFSWLVRARRYPLFLADTVGNAVASDGATVANRVPWDVLVFLHDHLPNTERLVGPFKQIVQNVMEIYASASQWQDDITNLTNLSLRGGTRRGRNPSFKGSSAVTDNTEALPCIDFGKLVSLSKSPILAKVHMPREDGIREMVESTYKFESQLRDFFTVEYFGDSFDLLAVPKDDSLVGDDGTFHLRRFTGSPLFEGLRNSITQVSGFLTTMVVSSSKRVAFDWIRTIFSWVDLLDSSVSADGPYFQHLSIASAKANEIILGWGAMFQDLPDDLVTLLDEYCIDVKTTPGGSISVDTRIGCSHNSLGVVLLRWCPFIYDALKMDLSAVREWEGSAKKLLNEYNQFQQRHFGHSPSDPKVMQVFFKNRDEATRLLHDLAVLFLTPDSALVDHCLSLLKLTESHLKSYSNPEVMKTFAETTYFNDEALVKNRHQLLDALSERLALARRPLDLSMDRKSGDGTVRQQCQTSFLRALLKTLSIVGFEDTTELRSLCAFKAWDIEKCLYDLCSESKQETEQKQLYHTKGMTLKRFLGDLSNLTLILKVINDEIPAAQLVRMDAEELANALIKKSREEASEAARQRLLLTGPQTTAKETVIRKPAPAAKAISAVNVPTSVAARPAASVKKEPVDLKASAKPPAKGSTSTATTNPAASSKSDSGFKTESKPALVARKSSSDEPYGSPITGRSMKISDLVSKKRASGPPPPPPSLVQLSLASGTKPAAPPRTFIPPMHSISNTSGGYQFTLIVQHNDEFHRQFHVAFVAEADSKRVAGNRRLTETLRHRGRMGGEDLLKFLAEKMNTGRNEILSFQVVPVSDSDTRALQQSLEFFADRILMLRSDGSGQQEGGEKAYLVSPRFHRFCRRYVTFDDPNSSYIVLVVKKRDGTSSSSSARGR